MANGLKGWIDLLLKHFWPLLVIAVLIAWVVGWLPMPSASEVIDFLLKMKGDG